MSVVVGTAGHIDHGKTTLLRALTGIDADRLPEEQRRGMTIDVGYAHLTLPGGATLDFVDVPGHDRLVGNMLVGAGEIDAALLVVAADDGPSPQTLEHLELLDALAIRDGLVAVTKADIAGDARAAQVADEVAALVLRTTLAGAPIHVVASTTGEGIEGLRVALAAMAERVAARLAGERAASGGPRLAIDRSFRVRGRGVVVTGSLRGGRVAAGDVLRLVPGDREVRVREVQARGAQVEASDGGRAALLLAGVELDDVPRGAVLTTDPAVVASSRVLVAVWAAAGLAITAGARRAHPLVPADREHLRLHLGTAQAGALVVRGPREAIDLPDGSTLAILRLDAVLAAGPGDRFALRRPSPGSTAGGGVVLDPLPPRGISRRRLTPGRAAALAADPRSQTARLDLHGSLAGSAGPALAPDVAEALDGTALRLVADHHAAHPDSPGLPLSALRQELARGARRLVTLDRVAAETVARERIAQLIAVGSLARDGDLLRDPARTAGPPPQVLAAMDRLEAALAVPAPPSLAEAARVAGCPPEGVRALEAASRIVRLEDDLAWAASTYRELSRVALSLAGSGPLSPAAFRDATGTSRKYVLVILEDLDRRGLLRRTDAGHVLGPKTLARLAERAAKAGGQRQVMRQREATAAIVLAGGASSRFETDKMAALLEGRPLLHHALAVADEVAATLVVVLAPGVEAVALPPVGARMIVAHDPDLHRGPLAGLAAGLAALAESTTGLDIVVVIGGDMPWVVPAVLARLLAALETDTTLGAATLEAEPTATLPLAVRASLVAPAAAALLAGGRRALRGVLATVPAVVVPAPTWRAFDPNGLTLRDVDHPRDLGPG